MLRQIFLEQSSLGRKQSRMVLIDDCKCKIDLTNIYFPTCNNRREDWGRAWRMRKQLFPFAMKKPILVIARRRRINPVHALKICLPNPIPNPLHHLQNTKDENNRSVWYSVIYRVEMYMPLVSKYVWNDLQNVQNNVLSWCIDMKISAFLMIGFPVGQY